MCWAGQRERAGLDRQQEPADVMPGAASGSSMRRLRCSSTPTERSNRAARCQTARAAGCARSGALALGHFAKAGSGVLGVHHVCRCLSTKGSMNELQPPPQHHQVGTIQWLSAPQKRSMHRRAVQRWDRPCCRDRHRRVRCVVRDSNSGHQLLWPLLPMHRC